MGREIKCGRTYCNHNDRSSATCNLSTIAIDSKGQCVCYDEGSNFPYRSSKKTKEREAYEGA